MSATITTSDLTVPSSLGDMTFRLHQSGPNDGPAVLWLHGSGPGADAYSNWEWQLGELGDEFHNIAPDVIGFGRSTHPDPPPQGLRAFTELRVETLRALLDALDIETATFVGNSMGGIITLAFALTHPERVDRMILMGAGGSPVPITAELLKLILFYEDPSEEAMAELLTCFVHDPAFFGDDLQKIADDSRTPPDRRSSVRTVPRSLPATIPSTSRRNAWRRSLTLCS